MAQAGIASLWIGAELGWIEKLCLASFVAQGHAVTLFSYDPVAGVPEGVSTARANEIWDMPDPGFVARTGPSYVADIFRIHLMAKTDLIWVDTDAYCLKPFVPDGAGFLVGHYHDRVEIANGVVRLPQGSETLAFLQRLLLDRDFIPPWIRPALRKRLERMPAEARFEAQYHIKRTILGPRALTAGLRQTGEDSHAVHERVLYPVPWELNDIFFNPYGGVDGWCADDTISVHFYGSQIRRANRHRFPPHPDSFLGGALAQHGMV